MWTCNFFNASAELSIFPLMDFISLSSLWDGVSSRDLNFFVAGFCEEGRFLSHGMAPEIAFALLELCSSLAENIVERTCLLE